MAKNRTEKLIGNTAMIAAGQFGSKILVYLLTRLYTSLLTSSEYSLASNISELASLLIPLISFGFGEAIFRLAKGGEYRRKEVFTSAFVIWGMGSLLLFAIIPILWQIDYFRNYVFLVVFYAMASIFHTICTNYIRSQGKVRLYAIQGILNTALVISLNILFLIPLHMSSVGYVLSVPVADLLITLFLIAKEKLWKDFSIKDVHAPAIRKMLRYSVPLIPTTVFMWIINLSDRFMVTYFCGDSVNGLYSAAYKIPTLLGVLNSVFIYAWQLSAMDEKNSSDKKRYYTRIFAVYSSILYLLGGGIILFSRVITALMFASSYADAWIYIPILTLAMVLHNFASYLDSENMVRMKSLPTMFTALFGAAVNLILNLILIPTFGGVGAAIATYVSYLATFVTRAVIVRDSIQVHPLITLINNVLLLGMVVLTMTRWSMIWILGDVILLAALFWLNRYPILYMARGVITGLMRRLKARR